MPTMITLIEQEMNNDDENRTKQSAILDMHYEEADAKGKELIDNVLICLCGWSYTTLKEKLKESDDEEEDNG